MRITMLDRWLLLWVLICLCLVVASSDLFSACDQKCREVKWYYQDLGTSVQCYDMKQLDCSPCALGNGSCDDSNGPGKGDCMPGPGEQEYSEATNCQLRCTLAPKGYAEAKAGFTKNKYTTIDLYKCIDIGGN